MLVTQDGSKLEDEPGTQDMSHIVSQVAIQLQNAFSYKCIDMHTCACTQVYLSCVAIYFPSIIVCHDQGVKC